MFHGIKSKIRKWFRLWLSYGLDAWAQRDMKCCPTPGMHGLWRLIFPGWRKIFLPTSVMTELTVLLFLKKKCNRDPVNTSLAQSYRTCDFITPPNWPSSPRKRLQSLSRLTRIEKADNSSRDEVHENNSRIHLYRSQNKYTNCKGIKNNTNSG